MTASKEGRREWNYIIFRLECKKLKYLLIAVWISAFSRLQKKDNFSAIYLLIIFMDENFYYQFIIITAEYSAFWTRSNFIYQNYTDDLMSLKLDLADFEEGRRRFTAICQQIYDINSKNLFFPLSIRKAVHNITLHTIELSLIKLSINNWNLISVNQYTHTCIPTYITNYT